MASTLPSDIWLLMADNLYIVCQLSMITSSLARLLKSRQSTMLSNPSDNDILSLGIRKFYRYPVRLYRDILPIPEGHHYSILRRYEVGPGRFRWFTERATDITNPDYYILPSRYVVFSDILSTPHRLSLSDQRQLSCFISIQLISAPSYYILLNDKKGRHRMCKKMTKSIQYNVYYAHYRDNHDILSELMKK